MLRVIIMTFLIKIIKNGSLGDFYYRVKDNERKRKNIKFTNFINNEQCEILQNSGEHVIGDHPFKQYKLNSSSFLNTLEVLKNLENKNSIYWETIFNLQNNISSYYHNFIKTYSMKFATAYGLVWYYFYDLLYDKLGIFYIKYSE